MTRHRALLIGWASIGVALSVQLFNDFACYDQSVFEALSYLWFPAIPLIPSLLALFSRNPLTAVGGSFVCSVFYGWAYYTDCVLPYAGGGASMVYIAIIFYGTPLAITATLFAGLVCKLLGIKIEIANKTS